MKERPKNCVSAIDCASRCPYRVMLEDGHPRFEDMALLELLQLRTQIEGEICKRLGTAEAVTCRQYTRIHPSPGACPCPQCTPYPRNQNSGGLPA